MDDETMIPDEAIGADMAEPSRRAMAGRRIVCAWCGSTNVSRDAWSAWDVAAQQWVLEAVFDDGFCHVCGCARELEEVGFAMMSWSEAVLAAVARQASRSPEGRFSRADLIEQELQQVIADCGSTGATPHQTLSRELQQMRDAGRLEFLDDRGAYRWRG